MATRGPRVCRFILNCDRSTDVQSDWTFEDAVEAGVVADSAVRPADQRPGHDRHLRRVRRRRRRAPLALVRPACASTDFSAATGAGCR